MIAGHSSSLNGRNGEVFKRLPVVRIGDRVDVCVGGRRMAYEVAATRVVPATAGEVMNPTQDPTLTLVTCWPVSTNANRLVVTGKLVEGAA